MSPTARWRFERMSKARQKRRARRTPHAGHIYDTKLVNGRWLIADRYVLTEVGVRTPTEAHDERLPDPDQVALCRRFIESCCTRAGLHSGFWRNSYQWKHAVERWAETIGPHEYVSNGAFIQAVIEMGIGFKIDREFPINPRVRIKIKGKPLSERTQRV